MRQSKASLDAHLGYDTCDDGNMNKVSKGSQPIDGGDRIARLVDWHSSVLLPLLMHIVKTRQPVCDRLTDWHAFCDSSTAMLDEVAEIVELPDFTAQIQAKGRKEADVDKEIENQLHEYVANIAGLYPDNPFHNFEHASHVTLVRSDRAL